MRTLSVPLCNLSFHPSTYNTQYHLFLVEPTIKDSIALRFAELIKALDLLATSDLSFGMWVIRKRGCSEYGGRAEQDRPVPQQIPQLACYCLNSSTWKLVSQTWPHWLSFEWSACASCAWVPCFAMPQRCPFYDCCIDVTVSVLSTETVRSWTTSNQASCVFQTHPYLSHGRSHLFYFLTENSLYPLVPLLPHVQSHI